MMEENQKDLPWKKELIVKLFRQQRILRVVFLGTVLIYFLLFVFLFVWEYSCGYTLYKQNKQTFDWVEIPCMIESVEWCFFAKENPYELWDPADPDTREDGWFETKDSNHYKIQYRYTYDGKSYVSRRYSIARAYEMVVWEGAPRDGVCTWSQFEEKQEAQCYVNPESPDDAVLSRAPLGWSDYALHLPMQFLVFILYLLCLIVPAMFFKQLRVNQKQLSELITGQKEDFLADMDRVATIPDSWRRKFEQG